MANVDTLGNSVLAFCGLTSDFLTEIQELNGQCKADLQRVGVLADNISDSDSNIITACKLYAAYMRDINGKGAQYKEDYYMFRDGLANNQDYITESEE